MPIMLFKNRQERGTLILPRSAAKWRDIEATNKISVSFAGDDEVVINAQIRFQPTLTLLGQNRPARPRPAWKLIAHMEAKSAQAVFGEISGKNALVVANGTENKAGGRNPPMIFVVIKNDRVWLEAKNQASPEPKIS